MRRTVQDYEIHGVYGYPRTPLEDAVKNFGLDPLKCRVRFDSQNRLTAWQPGDATTVTWPQATWSKVRKK